MSVSAREKETETERKRRREKETHQGYKHPGSFILVLNNLDQNLFNNDFPKHHSELSSLVCGWKELKLQPSYNL